MWFARQPACQAPSNTSSAGLRIPRDGAALAGGGACLRDTESRTTRRLIWRWPIDPQRARLALRQPVALGCYRSLKLGLAQPLAQLGRTKPTRIHAGEINEGPSSVPGPSCSMLLCLGLRRVSVVSGLVPERAVVL